VIDVVKARLPRSARILRARFSALSQSDIDKAMATLGEPNANEAMAVDARQELDLKVGIAFSRFQTRYFQAGSVTKSFAAVEIVACSGCLYRFTVCVAVSLLDRVGTATLTQR
jgi:DNA topoisomerase III